MSVDQPAAPRAGTTTAHAQTGGWYPWYVVVILSAAAALAYVDRMIVGLLTEPIKLDLGLTDFELSLLHGLAFFLFYCAMAIPLGYLSDRVARRSLIGVGIFLWSIATAACGLTKSFLGLFAARLGVGIGEASLHPGTQSLLPDYFEPHRLARAFAIFQIGGFLGAALAYTGGGLLLDAVKDWNIVVPGVGHLAPWQLVFILVAAPGPVIALLMMTVREPQRRQNPLLNAGDDAGFGRLIADRKLFYGCIFVAAALLAVLGYGISSWTPSFFFRSFGWTPTEVGLAYGLIVLFGSGPGTFLGSAIARNWIDRRTPGIRNRLVAWSFALIVPFAVAFPLVGDPLWTLVALGGFQFFMGAFAAMYPAILQFATPHHYRGRIAGMSTFASGALGASFGPIIIASVTDFVFQDTQRVRDSIALVAAVAGPIMIVLMVVVYREFIRLTKPADGPS